MRNAFHTRQLNLRQTAIKAYVPRGVEIRNKSNKTRKSPNQPSWQVVVDPSGTLSKDAIFGKMDIDVGARFGAWAKGTIFQNMNSGLRYYYDFEKLKIRRVKDEQEHQ